MDNVVTSLLVLEGDGVVNEQAGGYSDWEARGGKLLDTVEQAPPAQVNPEKKPEPIPARKRKLSYKEQRELDALPAKIDALEQRQAQLEAAVSQPDFYQQDHAQVEQQLAELTQVQRELEAAFERWAELED